MTYVEKISIFLASPNDVQRERKYVHEVIIELNKTTASSLGVTLEVVDSGRAFPAFGKDGQAIINEQLGGMQKYDLFVAIFWNRIGTATPRDVSGTVEEFTQAFRALRTKKRPQIWLYFCNAPFAPTTQDELDQKSGVITFRKKLRGKGLWRDYQNPRDFVTQFRMHLTTWLHERSAKTPVPKQVKKVKQSQPRVPQVAQSSGSKRPTPEIHKDVLANSSTPRSRASRSTSVNRRSDVVKSPSSWIMLNDRFFRSHPTVGQTDQSIVLHITPDTLEDADEILALQPTGFHSRRQVTFASLHHAGVTSVQSIASESRAGKTIFTVTLAPFSSSQANNLLGEYSYSSYSADDIATLRAQLILLGQPLPKQIEHLGSSYQSRNSLFMTTTTAVDTLPRLWATLKTDTRSFMPKAWLYGAYLLKMGGIVETIQTFELGPIKNHAMHIKFRGKRHKSHNREPFIVTTEGECRLEL